MELHVAQADLATLAVDAVIVPCTSMGTVTAPVRKSLSAETAALIETELKEKSPLAMGAAMLADAKSLGAGSAILVPVKKHDDDDVAIEHLRRALKAALHAANIKRYDSVAFPSMVQPGSSTTRAEAARAMVQEINTHKAPFPQKVYLVDASEDMVRIFEDVSHTASRGL